MDLDVNVRSVGQQGSCENSQIEVHSGCGSSSTEEQSGSGSSSTEEQSGSGSPSTEEQSCLGSSSTEEQTRLRSSPNKEQSGSGSLSTEEQSGLRSSPSKEQSSCESSSTQELDNGKISLTVSLVEASLNSQKPEASSTDSTGSNSNLYPVDGDGREIEKSTVSVTVAAGSSVPVPVGTVGLQMDNSNLAEMASRTVFSAVSRLLVEAPKQNSVVGNSDPSQRELGTESSSSIASSTSRDSISELQLAARKARECVVYYRKLIGVMDESAKVLQEFIGYFQDRSRNGSPGNMNYVALAEQYEEFTRILRRKAVRLEEVVKLLEEGVTSADQRAAAADGVTENFLADAGRANFLADWYKNNVDSACILSHSVEYSILETMKKIVTALKDSTHLLDVSSDTISSQEYSQECENRDRKTKTAHVAALVIGAALVAATFLLFKMGSDSFYAILCLGILTLGWAVLYWCVKLYLCVKSRLMSEQAETDSIVELLDSVDERMEYIKEYLKSHEVSPGPEWDNGELEQ